MAHEFDVRVAAPPFRDVFFSAVRCQNPKAQITKKPSKVSDASTNICSRFQSNLSPHGCQKFGNELLSNLCVLPRRVAIKQPLLFHLQPRLRISNRDGMLSIPFHSSS